MNLFLADFVLVMFAKESQTIASVSKSDWGAGLSTVFVVQSFTRGGRGSLRPDVPVQVQSTSHAIRMAERLSVTKVLVVAFRRDGDTATGEFDDPVLIAALGDVPDEIAQMRQVETVA
jgi:hypothetical protein